MSTLPIQFLVAVSLPCGLALVLLVIWRSSGTKKLPLPPGPKGYPVLGSALDLPKESEWLAYSRWQKSYGDLVFFTVLGQPFLLVSSLKTAYDLLEKRSAIYSGRMKFTFGGELCDYNRVMTLQEGTPHRDARRVGHGVLTPSAMKHWDTLQEAEAHKTLRTLLQSPNDFVHHFRRTSTALIMRIIYGYELVQDDDPFLAYATETLHNFSDACQPGRWLVDIIPPLKFVPSWMPGASFQRIAREWNERCQRFFDEPFHLVKEQMKAGTALSSMIAKLLETCEAKDEEAIKNSAGSLYGGGVDTTPSALTSFPMAMVLYPEAQRAAQEELDRVIGGDRLPEMSDREQLPYVDALVREVLRWGLVLPMGVPHRLIQDDEYEGYHLPKDTIVLTNIWHMARDTGTYGEEAEGFRPERFLGKEPAPKGFTTQNTQEFGSPAFGFGRRVCPGQHMAFRTLFIICANVLATMDITPCIDADGKSMLPKPEYTGGVITHPKPFKCTIKPRSEKAVELINGSA